MSDPTRPSDEAEDQLREHAETGAEEGSTEPAAGADTDVLREHAEDPAEG
jgi:hypothetical protein